MRVRLSSAIGFAIGGVAGLGLVSWLAWTGRDADLVNGRA